MGFLDWLFSAAKEPLSSLPGINQQLILKLVPKAFDPDGAEGDLMWYGCVIEDQFGGRYSYDDERLTAIGLHIFRVAGVSRRKRELQSEDFAPANFVSLMKEDDNAYDKNAVAVYNKTRQIMVGYVPKEQTQPIRKPMLNFPDSRTLVLAHCVKKKTRVGLTVLFRPIKRADLRSLVV